MYIGLDIGGTKLLVAAADTSGAIVRRVQRPTPQPLAEGLALLHTMIGEVAAGAPISAIGAAAGGPLDWQRGVVSPLHQPTWNEVPLKALFEATYGCRFAVDVDTNVAALGEYRFGGAQPESLLYLTLSTGMGGGLIIGGKIFRGAGGAHPEAGHQSIPFRVAHSERIRCACGGDDCPRSAGFRPWYRTGLSQAGQPT